MTTKLHRFNQWAATRQAYAVVTLAAPFVGLLIGFVLKAAFR